MGFWIKEEIQKRNKPSRYQVYFGNENVDTIYIDTSNPSEGSVVWTAKKYKVKRPTQKEVFKECCEAWVRRYADRVAFRMKKDTQRLVDITAGLRDIDKNGEEWQPKRVKSLKN